MCKIQWNNIFLEPLFQSYIEDEMWFHILTKFHNSDLYEKNAEKNLIFFFYILHKCSHKEIHSPVLQDRAVVGVGGQCTSV